MTTTLDIQHSAIPEVLYIAFELSNAKWWLGFSNGRKIRRVTIEAGNHAQLHQAVSTAREKLKVTTPCQVYTCCEAFCERLRGKFPRPTHQDHRGIKSRYKVMKGFSNIFCALIFCTAFEEIRQFFCMANKTRAERRREIPFKIEEYRKLCQFTS